MSEILKKLRMGGYSPNTNLASGLRTTINRATSRLGKTRGTELFSSYVEVKEQEDKYLRELLQKSLAASLDAIKEIDDIEKRSKVSNKINRALNRFNEEGEVDVYELKDLGDSIRELTHSNNSVFEALDKLVNLDTDSLVRKHVTEALISAGGSESDRRKLMESKITPQQYADKNNLNDVLERSLTKDNVVQGILNDQSPSNPQSKHDYQNLVNEYRNGNLNAQTFSQSARILPGIDAVAINKLATILERIEENTDPNNNKLNQADEIRNQRKSEAELAAFRDISEFIKDSKSTSASTAIIKNAMSASSDEEFGANVADSIMDMFGNGGDDYIDGPERERGRGRSKSEGKVRGRMRRGGRGKLGRLGRLGAGAAKLGKGGLGMLSKAGRGAIRAAPAVGTALTVGMGAYDYATADDSAGRIDAVSQTGGALAGAAAGAAVGSVVPVIGTAIGAIAGGLLGVWGGSWLGDQIKDPIDIIPDKIKNSGPLATLNYIDNALYPTLYASIEAGNSQYSKDDLDKLLKYRKTLIEEDIPKYMKEHAKDVNKDDLDYYNRVQQNPELPQQYSELYDQPIVLGSGGGISVQHGNKDFKIDASHGIGQVSSKYETGGRGVGTISSGKGDAGGVSYGSWQLSSKTGTMAAFLKSDEAKKYAGAFQGLRPGTPEFNRAYSEVVKQDAKGFEAAQKAFLKRTHFDPVAEYAKSLGMDVDNPAIQEALWSQSIQHGFKGNQQILDQWAKQGGKDQSFNKSVTTLYQARGDYASRFANTAATTNRYKNELADVIAYHDQMSPEVKAQLDQGNDNPVHVALATGKNVREVQKEMASNDVAPKEYTPKVSLEKANLQVQAPPATVIPMPSSSGNNDPHRLTDQTIQVAAMLRG